MNQLLIRQKMNRREQALKLLEAQLKSGIKPISKGPKPYKLPEGEYSYVPVPGVIVPEKLDKVPLSSNDKVRIDNQIMRLQTNINRDRRSLGLQ